MDRETTSALASGSPDSTAEAHDQQHGEKPATSCQAMGEEEEDTSGHLHSWRLWLVAISISIVYFAVQVEISIVTTSLVNITQDITGFERAGWVMSAYLLGFVSKSHLGLFSVLLNLVLGTSLTGLISPRFCCHSFETQ